MGKSERYPSYATCVARALSASQQPLTIDGLLTVIGRQRPLGAGARRAIYRAVRELYQAVPVAPSGPGSGSRMFWRQRALPRARSIPHMMGRMPISRAILRRGLCPGVFG